MNNILLYKVANTYLLYHKYKNLSKNIFNHINSCSIENDIKTNKLIKLQKLIIDIEYILKIPISLHKFAFNWIKYRFFILIKQSGYLTIKKTLRYIYFTPEDNKLVSDNMQNHINNDLYNNFIVNLIKPMHCKIIKKKNTNKGVKIYSIKPSLNTIDGKLDGLCVEYMNQDISCIIFGFLDRDSLNNYRSLINKEEIKEELHKNHKFEEEIIDSYLKSFRFRDYLIYETRQIVNKIKQKIEKIEYYKTVDNNILYNEFSFLPYENKIELLTSLLQLGIQDKIDFITSCFKFNPSHFDLNLRIKIKNINKIYEINKKEKTEITIEDKINTLNTSKKNKSKVLDKLKIINMSNDGAPKAQKYLDGFLKIPFGKIRIEDGLYNPEDEIIKDIKQEIEDFDIKNNNLYKSLLKLTTNKDKNISTLCKKKLEYLKESRKNHSNYLKKVENILDNSVHGHELVKTQFKRLLAQWITGGQSGIVIGIEGPPGVGKTSLIKEGLSKCLLNDEGKSRPVGFIPLGGSSNASTLVGHGYTYQGSTWGRIVDIIMDCECMNPIFLFDELDKVSRTESGREIISILTHLTDSSQNKEFYDKYFEGVSLDLSKALMIFTFNSRNEIDPILLDRMTIIETKALTLEDKRIITKKHLIPQISNKININPKNIKLTCKTIDNIIHDYTREAGVRQLKRILENLCQELNLRRLLKPSTKLEINDKLINNVMFHKDKIIDESISSLDSILGQINGMYANVLGLGGILPIQVSKNIADDKMVLTGMQGDVMKESMICAKTNAYELLKKFNKEFELGDKSDNGLHIHVPSASTPKDGPSAGGAISLAIYSFLSKRPIKTDIAMTGEIDLRGNIKAIGGLYAKLHGAKKAKIKTALIPYENKEQLNRIRSEGKSPEDDFFKIILIKHIEETLQYVFH